MSSPHLLVVDASIWAASLLGVACNLWDLIIYLFIFPPRKDVRQVLLDFLAKRTYFLLILEVWGKTDHAEGQFP